MQNIYRLKKYLCLSAFNDLNKEAGFYTARLNKNADPVKLIFEKASFHERGNKSPERRQNYLAERIICSLHLNYT